MTKRILISVLVVLIHLGLTLFCYYHLMNLEDGNFEATSDSLSTLSYFMLRFVLSFPLGIVAWFAESFMANMLLLSIPNALLLANAKTVYRWIRQKVS